LHSSRALRGNNVLTLCAFSCRYDLADTSGNPETVTIQTSLQACISACDVALSGQCPGVTWVPTGQTQQYCYYKPATSYPLGSGSNVWSAQRITVTTPTCPSGNQSQYRGADGSMWRLDCNLDYPVSVPTRLRLCNQILMIVTGQRCRLVSSCQLQRVRRHLRCSRTTMPRCNLGTEPTERREL